MSLTDLKQEAKALGIPIIEDEGIAFLLKLIEERHVKNILEIGTAIGYSALMMAAFDVHIDTIEREESMLEHARKNFKQYDHHQSIHLIEADALTYDGPLQTYDLIFIDGAKSQYLTFFEKYQAYLNPGGVIVCDNLHFHHLDVNEVTNRHTKALLRRLEKFRQFLKNHEAFQTTFIDLGDGLSVSERK